MAYDLTQPESAAETYLAKLTGDYSGELPDPITRIDFYPVSYTHLTLPTIA